jgi:hypothetical protein
MQKTISHTESTPVILPNRIGGHLGNIFDPRRDNQHTVRKSYREDPNSKESESFMPFQCERDGVGRLITVRLKFVT